MSDVALGGHATAALVRVVKRSIASLRLAVEDLKIKPDKLAIARIVEESGTVSGAVAALANTIDLSEVDLPTEAETIEGETLLEDGMRLVALLEHGPCERCGGACTATLRTRPVTKFLELEDES